MAGGKLSPRQKMINMMYLVLTALLAMNVSKEILNSFALLNNGLEKTNENFALKNDVTYGDFKMQLALNPVKVRPYMDAAFAVKKRSQEMFDYIEKLKKDLIEQVEEKSETTIKGRGGADSVIKIASDIMYMEGKDNNQIPTHFFMGDLDKAAPGNRAYEFKEKIDKFKQDLKSYIPEKDRDKIKLGLETADVFSSTEDMMVSWENNNFYHNPAVAVIAILTKMQNDVKNAETDIINALYNQINMRSYKFDRVEARVNAESNYVLLGDQYRAEIFAGGFSTTSNPEIWLGDYDTLTKSFRGPIDSTSVIVKDGIGIYNIAPNAEGTTVLKGVIRIKNPAMPLAPPNVFPFASEYKSARPATVVSPERMNVFYKGLENPVAISVPGIAAEDLVVGLSGAGGNIVKVSNGKYLVKVNNGTECKVNVSARMKDGTVRPMGTGIPFRIKKVPNPVAECFGKRGIATVRVSELKFITTVVAKLDDFVFNVPFPVVSFDVTVQVNGVPATKSSNSSSLTTDQKELVTKARRNNYVTIENVKVKKPSGETENIGGVTLKVI